MKKLIIFFIFLSIACVLFGQERITLTTTKAVGASIMMTVNAGAADRAETWIDLNNNGVRDNGEDIKAWDAAASYTLQSQTFTIYGKLIKFTGNGQALTALDLRDAPYLTFLRVDDNLIEELDLSALPKEFYNLHISKNKLRGVLDVSHLQELQTMNIDRNYLTSVIMGNHHKLGQNINISRNLFSEAAIDAIMEKVPNRTGSSLGNFYLIDTRTNDPQYEEGNQLKQHHLAHRVFTDYNWRSLDVNGATVLTDISRLTNKYTTSFTTARSTGGQITLNIHAETSDEPSVWIDLNGNGQKDGNESVTTFGSDVSYTISSPNIAIYGLASSILAPDNQLTKFDASKNSFLDELNIATNSLTLAEIDNFVEKLNDRTGTSPGTLTLLNFEGDGNQVISEHISKANAKNWVVKDVTGRTLSPSDITSLTQTIKDLTDIATYPGEVVTLPEFTDQGLAITYSMEPGKEAFAKLSENTLTSIGYGEVLITVTQAGNELYEEFSTTITVSIMPAGETFSWLGLPTIGLIGNNVFIAGSKEAASQFTKFYVNDVQVELVDGNVDVTDYEGNLKLKATNADGSQIIRLTIEK